MLKYRGLFKGIDFHNFFLVLFIFIIICIGIRVPILYIFPFIITIYCSLFKKLVYTFSILFFMLPFEQITKFSVSSSSIFTYCLLVSSIILFFRIKSFNRNYLLLLLAFSVYTFIGAGDNYTDWIKLIFGFIILYCFIKTYKRDYLKDYSMAFSLGLILSCLIGNYKNEIELIGKFFSEMNSEYINGTATYRFSGLYLDPNYFSVSVIFAIYLCLILFIKKEISRVVSASLIILLIYYGIQSYSKAFIIGLVLILVSFMFFGFNDKRFLLLKVLIILAVIIGFLLLTRYTPYFSGIVSRFQKDDISNGRISIWESYINYFINNLQVFIFGDGLKATYLTNVGGAHNSYIEIIYHLGIVGSVLYILLVVFNFLKKILDKRVFFNYSLLLIYLILIFTLGMLKNNDTVFYYMLIWMVLNCNIIFERKGAVPDEH